MHLLSNTSNRLLFYSKYIYKEPALCFGQYNNPIIRLFFDTGTLLTILVGLFESRSVVHFHGIDGPLFTFTRTMNVIAKCYFLLNYLYWNLTMYDRCLEPVISICYWFSLSVAFTLNSFLTADAILLFCMVGILVS